METLAGMKRGAARAGFASLGTAALVLGSAMALPSTAAFAQSAETARPPIDVNMEISPQDATAPRSATRQYIHTFGARRADGSAKPSKTFRSDAQGNLVEVGAAAFPQRLNLAGAAVAATPAVPGFGGPGFYPSDLDNPPVPPNAIPYITPTPVAGPVITNATVYNVYLNGTGSDFSGAQTFIARLLPSGFLHVIDQYVGTTAAGRYTFGGSIGVTYPVKWGTLNDFPDIQNIVTNVSNVHGAGYTTIYNVFIPPGVTECFATNECFSPGNLTDWAYCGYHSWITVGTNDVLYTVIPYQDQGYFDPVALQTQYPCDVGQTVDYSDGTATPNGVETDSIASVLAHETAETITDPDGTGWQTWNSLALYGYEIGDVCANPYFLYTAFNVGGANYYIQPLYSNKYHACVTVP